MLAPATRIPAGGCILRRVAALADAQAFAQWLAPLRACEWVVYAKRPFAGPAAVLAYLSRYTHRVAISNSRLLAFDERGVTFRWKDYRSTGKTRYKAMTLAADEFMRRFLLHVLPSGFHRIRHYGLLANAGRRSRSDSSPFRIGARSDAVCATDWRHWARLGPSNPHSRLASPNDSGACRGFLPRRWCDACRSAQRQS